MCAHSYSSKGQEQALSLKPQFLSKQIDISGKTALLATRSLSQHSDTCSNPLKTCHAVKSLPPNTCCNLCEQHPEHPPHVSPIPASPTWLGGSRAGAPCWGPHFWLLRGIVCRGCCQSQHISQALRDIKENTKKKKKILSQVP